MESADHKKSTETPSTSATAHPPEPPQPAAANGTAPQKRGRRTWLIAGAAVLAVAAIVAAALSSEATTS